MYNICVCVEQFDSIEDEPLRVAADQWQAGLSKSFPKREYTATVINLEGISVFVTRYIRPLNPPPELIKGDLLSTSTAVCMDSFLSVICYLIEVFISVI